MTAKELVDQYCEFRGKCTTDDVVALTYAYKSLQLDFVNKACEWLELNVCNAYNFRGDDISIGFVEQFRKAMKGE